MNGMLAKRSQSQKPVIDETVLRASQSPIITAAEHISAGRLDEAYDCYSRHAADMETKQHYFLAAEAHLDAMRVALMIGDKVLAAQHGTDAMACCFKRAEYWKAKKAADLRKDDDPPSEIFSSYKNAVNIAEHIKDEGLTARADKELHDYIAYLKINGIKIKNYSLHNLFKLWEAIPLV